MLWWGPGSAAVAAGPDEWGQAAGHATGDHFNPGETRLTAARVAKVKPGWTVPTAAVACADPSGPLVGKKKLVVADGYRVSGYDAGTGKLSWRTADAGKRDIDLLAVVGGRVLAQYRDCRTGKSFLTALDERTGKTVYTRPIVNPMYFPLADRGVLVGGLWDPAVENYGLRAYRISDGSLIWSRVGSFDGQPVSAGGRILVGGAALDITTGKPVWTLGGGCTNALGATPDGSRFYLACPGTDGVRMVGAADGRELGKFPGQYSGFATDGKRVYTQSGDGMHALDARTGKRAWSAAFADNPPILFAVAGGVVYGWRGSDRPLAAFVAATGKPLTLDPRTATYGDNVLITHGRLYGTTPSGVITFAP